MHRRTATRLLAALPLVAATLVASGCNRSTSDLSLVYRSPNELVEIANSRGGAFGSGGLPKVLWLDPRTEREFDAGHIPEATNIPFPEIEPTHEATCRGFDLFIVYDTDYDDVIAKAAAKRLLELGYNRVYNMRGGLKAWKAEGYGVETAEGAASPTPSQTAPARGG
jgi:phage shock protein E